MLLLETAAAAAAEDIGLVDVVEDISTGLENGFHIPAFVTTIIIAVISVSVFFIVLIYLVDNVSLSVACHGSYPHFLFHGSEQVKGLQRGQIVDIHIHKIIPQG